MVHFSAYYGLEQLTWTFLEIPGGEAALNMTNQNGHTPSVLAYQKGFHNFAQTLEDAAVSEVTSCLGTVCNMICAKNMEDLEKIKLIFLAVIIIYSQIQCILLTLSTNSISSVF